jgi:hypothetical protein
VTAASAFSRPQPYHWLKSATPSPVTSTYWPVGFVFVKSIFVAVVRRICRSSTHDSAGFTDRHSAAMPAESGVADDVPPNAFV